MDVARVDQAVKDLMKAWRLTDVPGVRFAAVTLLAFFEVVLVVVWPGWAWFILSQLFLILTVVLCVALVSAGDVWDGVLFDRLYRPEGTVVNGRAVPPGKYLQSNRPLGGLLPDGTKLLQWRADAAASLGIGPVGVYSAAEDFLENSEPGRSRLVEAAAPLELAKGVRALLLPLCVGVVVVAVLIVVAVVTNGNWKTPLALLGLFGIFWFVFAFVFIQRRYAHLRLLYRAVVQESGGPHAPNK